MGSAVYRYSDCEARQATLIFNAQSHETESDAGVRSPVWLARPFHHAQSPALHEPASHPLMTGRPRLVGEVHGPAAGNNRLALFGPNTSHEVAQRLSGPRPKGSVS